MNSLLFKRDNKSKIRVVSIDLNEHNTSDGTFYSISGETGLFQGKMVKRPLVVVDRGKVKRSVKDQAELQYKSLINSYLDKGYKLGSNLNISSLDDPQIEAKVPNTNTDQSGNLKPMLAKHYKDVANFDWSKNWECSYKYDGVRAMLFCKDGTILTSSRGGKNYNVAATYIINDEYVKQFFKANPNVILDGELYIHGKPLSYISGLCRLETLEDKHKELSFHCYDIVDETSSFAQRLEILKHNRQNCPKNSKLIFVEHIGISGKDNIMKLHEKAILEGYEGLILRDPSRTYKCGSRDRMYKVKEFFDAEFEILDIVEGLRDEDMCFLMKTEEDYEFKAKPIGDRALKQWYHDNVDSIRGKKGTVKYFGFTSTDKPVPNLPVFVSLVLEKDR